MKIKTQIINFKRLESSHDRQGIWEVTSSMELRNQSIYRISSKQETKEFLYKFNKRIEELLNTDILLFRVAKTNIGSGINRNLASFNKDVAQFATISPYQFPNVAKQQKKLCIPLAK